MTRLSWIVPAAATALGLCFGKAEAVDVFPSEPTAQIWFSTERSSVRTDPFQPVADFYERNDGIASFRLDRIPTLRGTIARNDRRANETIVLLNLGYTIRLTGAPGETIPLIWNGEFRNEVHTDVILADSVSEGKLRAESLAGFILDDGKGATAHVGTTLVSEVRRLYNTELGASEWHVSSNSRGSNAGDFSRVRSSRGTFIQDAGGSYVQIANAFETIRGRFDGRMTVNLDNNGTALVRASLFSTMYANVDIIDSQVSLGSISGESFVDPYFQIEPEYLANNPNASLQVLGGIMNTPPVPEPSTLFLGAIGLLLISKRFLSQRRGARLTFVQGALAKV
jgi:hypothetical protein